MVQKKTKLHPSVVNGGEEAEKGGGAARRRSTEPDDHWTFLDEIEAPMWLDLTLEAKSMHQEDDDEWFHISHPFHQYCSRQLVSAFSHGDEGSTKLDLGLPGPCSPKLPSSVSRSRGKHYRSKDWGQSNCRVTSNKQHPVKNLSSISLSDQETKPKSIFGNPKGNAGSKAASSVCESNLTEIAGSNNSKLMCTSGDIKTTSTFIAVKEGDSKSTSSIAYESNVQQQQQQKFLEVTGQTNGDRSRLLSSLKFTLRKSCATRQASRIEITGGRQSDGRKSSSGKSSVGSSSNLGYININTTLDATRKKEKTPDSRNVVEVSRTTNNKAKATNVSNAQVQKMTSKSRLGGKIVTEISTHQEPAKSRVRCQTQNAKAVVLQRVNKQDHVNNATKAEDRAGASRYEKMRGGGKENKVCRTSATQKSSTRDNTAGGVIQDHKLMKPKRRDRTGLIFLKENANGQSEGKILTYVTQKVYLR